MTPEQLLSLGASKLAYLRFGILDGQQVFLLIRGDGRLLEVVGAMEKAVDRAFENGFSFVTVR